VEKEGNGVLNLRARTVQYAEATDAFHHYRKERREGERLLLVKSSDTGKHLALEKLEWCSTAWQRRGGREMKEGEREQQERKEKKERERES
jgi:hypothetical protein